MKLATFIVTVLAAAVVTVEAHNVRVGEREHHKPREHRDHQKSRTGDASDDGPQTIIGGTQSTENEFPYYGEYLWKSHFIETAYFDIPLTFTVVFS